MPSVDAGSSRIFLQVSCRPGETVWLSACPASAPLLLLTLACPVGLRNDTPEHWERLLSGATHGALSAFSRNGGFAQVRWKHTAAGRGSGVLCCSAPPPTLGGETEALQTLPFVGERACSSDLESAFRTKSVAHCPQEETTYRESATCLGPGPQHTVIHP